MVRNFSPRITLSQEQYVCRYAVNMLITNRHWLTSLEEIHGKNIEMREMQSRRIRFYPSAGGIRPPNLSQLRGFIVIPGFNGLGEQYIFHVFSLRGLMFGKQILFRLKDIDNVRELIRSPRLVHVILKIFQSISIVMPKISQHALRVRVCYSSLHDDGMNIIECKVYFDFINSKI